MTPGKSSPLTKEIQEFIVQNCTMTGEELRQIIRTKYNVDVSVQTVFSHLRKARANAEEATRTADSILSQTISERVAQYAPVILNRYEKELQRIENILDGNDTEFGLDLSEVGTRHKYRATKYIKLYDDLAKSYLAMRPPTNTVRIESSLDPDVACMDTWSDEKLAAYEKFLKELESMD